MWNRHENNGNPSHRHGGGRHRAPTRRQDLFLLIQSHRQRFQNAKSLNNVFRNGTGVHISTQTVRHRPHQLGLNIWRPAIRLQVTRQQVQYRLDFAIIYVRLTIRDWMPVLFTESKVCLDFTDRRQLVWEIPKERFDELNVAERDRYGKGSVMVWAGISVNVN